MGKHIRARPSRLAEENFGWGELRPEQLAGMEHVAAGGDVLVVLLTLAVEPRLTIRMRACLGMTGGG